MLPRTLICLAFLLLPSGLLDAEDAAPANKAPQVGASSVPPLAPVPGTGAEDEQPVIDINAARIVAFPRFTAGGSWSRRFVNAPPLSFVNPLDIVKQDTSPHGELKELLTQWQRSVAAGKSSNLLKTGETFDQAIDKSTLSPIALLQLGNVLVTIEGAVPARSCYRHAIQRAQKNLDKAPRSVDPQMLTLIEAVLPLLAADHASADILHAAYLILVSIEPQGSAKRNAAAILFANGLRPNDSADAVVLDTLANAAAHDLNLTPSERVNLKWGWARALFYSGKYREAIPALRELMASSEKSAPSGQSCFLLVKCAVASGQNDLAQEGMKLWETRFAKPSDATATEELRADMTRGSLAATTQPAK